MKVRGCELYSIYGINSLQGDLSVPAPFISLFIVENLMKINTQDSNRMAEEIIRINSDMKGAGTDKSP